MLFHKIHVHSGHKETQVIAVGRHWCRQIGEQLSCSPIWGQLRGNVWCEYKSFPWLFHYMNAEYQYVLLPNDERETEGPICAIPVNTPKWILTLILWIDPPSLVFVSGASPIHLFVCLTIASKASRWYSIPPKSGLERCIIQEVTQVWHTVEPFPDLLPS